MGTSWWSIAWVWYGAGCALAGIGLALVLWALVWDRARGRRRCPRCWYDMSAARMDAADGGTWTCPECGRNGRGEKGLGRTRRRRGWACVAVLLLIGAWIAGEQPAIRVRGWMWLVPTWALVQTLPLGGRDGVIGMEVQRRLGRAPWPNGRYESTMSDGQIVSIFETCASGTWLARPVHERWRKSFGLLAHDELFQVYYARVKPLMDGSPREWPMAAPDIERVEAAIVELERLHGPLTVRTRARWPRGVPVHLEVPVETWWQSSMKYWMHVRWAVEGTEAKGDSWCTGHTEIKVPGEGHARLHIDLDWVEGSNAPRKAADGRVMATASDVLEYDVVPGIDDVMKPVSSAAMDAAIGAGVLLDREGMIDWSRLTAARAPFSSDVSFGLRIEYVLDGAVVGTARCRFVGGTGLSGCMGGPDMPGAKNWEEARKILSDPRLTARVVTDPVWAMYNIDATSYWKGEADVTLKPPKKNGQR